MTESTAAAGASFGARLVRTGLLYGTLYWGAAAVSWRDPVVLVPGALDALIPLVPLAIWVYFSALPMFACALWLSLARARLQLLDTLALVIAAAAAVFLLMPTVVPRRMADFSGLTGLAWQALYALDTPKNVLPSMHAAVAVLCVTAFWRRGGVWRVLGPLWALSVLLAALATKQHFLTDLLAGLALGALAQVCVRWRNA